MDFNDILQIIVSPTTAAFALAAIGLNFHYGLTGLLNMGVAGFMLIGMYGYGISVSHGVPAWLALIIAIVGAILFSLLLGWPTLRLRGDYLAIVTIAAAEIVRIIGRSQWLKEWTGGNTGIRGKDFKGPFEQLSPFPDAPHPHRAVSIPRDALGSWWLHPRWMGPRRRVSRCCSGGSRRARGVACSAASAKTKTRCGRLARTSTASRCRRS